MSHHMGWKKQEAGKGMGMHITRTTVCSVLCRGPERSCVRRSCWATKTYYSIFYYLYYYRRFTTSSAAAGKGSFFRGCLTKFNPANPVLLAIVKLGPRR